MELYIHGGLNKTATSYMQAVFEKNADFLRSHGISYAHSQGGFGNAAKLSLDLRYGNLKRLRARLSAYRMTAEATGCTRVLMSSELLYHDIVVPEHHEILLREIADAGFATPQLLLFFREPTAHAVSCFCHRSGVKNTGPFEEWLQNCYEFPRELAAFLAALDTGLGMELTVRYYPSDRLAIQMSDWLGTPPLPHNVGGQINVSVNAHEARLLSWVQQESAPTAARLRDALKALDPSAKAPDRLLRAHWHRLARESFAPIEADLDRLGTLLGTSLSPPLVTDSNTTPEAETIILSRAQLDAIRAALKPPDLPYRAAQWLYRWIKVLRLHIPGRFP